MSRQDEVLNELKRSITNAQGQGLQSVVHLPIDVALRIQTLIKHQHSALKAANELVDTLQQNYDNSSSTALLDEDFLASSRTIIKSALS